MYRPKANYEVVEDGSTRLVLRDLGPWDHFMTITNAAEEVLAELADEVGKRRLLYYDSEGELTEILHAGGRFRGFGNPYQGNAQETRGKE